MINLWIGNDIDIKPIPDIKIKQENLKTQKLSSLKVADLKQMCREKNLSVSGKKNDLIQTIPGSIEAIIQLTKGEPLNRNIKGLDIVESAYVTKRSVERILEFIRKKKYNLLGIVQNVFMIVTQIMYIVGSYPSLSGIQKKEIVTDVIREIITKYTENDTGNKIPDNLRIIKD